MEEIEKEGVRGRIKNFLIASTTWDGGERGGKKICSPHSTLKRVKVFLGKKGTISGRKIRTIKLHFYRQRWGGRHCAKAASLA